MTDLAAGAARHSRWLGPTRVGVGLLQGLALYGLLTALERKAWPATDAPLFAALILMSALAPLVVLAGLGRVRRLTLAIWTVVAAAMTGVQAWHHAASALAPDTFPMAVSGVGLFAATALFCAHHLIAAADAERKLVARYPAYFDAAWLDGVRLVLAIAFTAAFWILLELGASLFELIGLKGFRVVIDQNWFHFPALCVMFATGVHLADVRAGLTRGLRTVALILLSWLLPVMGAIAVAFLIALPFTGLAVLWRAGAATGVLLGSIGALVVLVNAAYQDGAQEPPAPAVLRWAARITAVALVPLAGVAVYGLALRIAEHGLTPSRIIAGACAAGAVCYAVGYAYAALRPGRWLRRLEQTNIVAAVAIIGLIVALGTSIADPSRIAVADQVARLERGEVTPAKFDFDFLRFRSGRYGLDALKRLAGIKRGSNAARIAALASDALRQSAQPYAWQRATAGDIAAAITVYPRGATLPADFITAFPRSQNPYCAAPNHCDAYLIDLDGDGSPEIVLHSYETVVYGKAAGAWVQIGRLDQFLCPATVDALQAGHFQLAPPQTRWKDIVAAGQHLTFVPGATPDCLAGVSAKPITPPPPALGHAASRATGPATASRPTPGR